MRPWAALIATVALIFIPAVAEATNTNAGNFGGGTGSAVLGGGAGTNSGVAIGTAYATSSTSAPTNGLIVQGNVGIGTASPQATLDVNGSARLGYYGSSPTFVGNGYGGNQLYTNTGANWNYGAIENIRSTSNTSPFRAMDFMLGGDTIGDTDLYDYPTLLITTSSAPIGTSTSTGLNAAFTINTPNYFSLGTGSGASGAERMRITSAGNVGVGTPGPAANFEIDASNATTAFSIAGGSPTMWLVPTGGVNPFPGSGQSYNVGLAVSTSSGAYGGGIGDLTLMTYSDGSGQSNAIRFVTATNSNDGTAERMRIAGTTGNIGIGTASPQNLLDVNGSASIGYNVAAPSNGLIVSGAVAIGTTAPASSYIGFDVAEPIIRFGQPYAANYPPGGLCSACTYLVLDTTTNNDASIVFRTNGNLRAEIGLVTDDSIHFRTGNGTYPNDAQYSTDRMVILGSSSANPGYVGIGTVPPNYPFEVNLATDRNFAVNTGGLNIVHLFASNDAGTASEDMGFGVSEKQIYLTAGGVVLVNWSSSQSGCCLLQVNGTIGATNQMITGLSDKRLKTDIAPLGTSLPIIMALKPVSFEFLKNQLTPAGAKLAAEQKATPWKFKSEAGILQPKPDAYNFPDGTQIGFIAQDVAEAAKNKPYLSALVDVPDHPRTDYYTMREGNMIPLLVKAIQEQQAEIDELKRTNSAMKGKLGM